MERPNPPYDCDPMSCELPTEIFYGQQLLRTELEPTNSHVYVLNEVPTNSNVTGTDQEVIVLGLGAIITTCFRKPDD
jgi:hypothetical protein